MEVLINGLFLVATIITILLLLVTILNRDIVEEVDGELIYWFEQDDFNICGKGNNYDAPTN